MNRLPLSELEHRCQKPDHRRLGNWMARHVSRPAALRITRVVAPWGVSANTVTLAAWGCGAAGAAALAWGTICGWIVGAVLLQLWYLLDHVDGQLARLRGTASLDGVQLDYLMHHTINLLVPLGIGCGLLVRTAEPLYVAAGLLWGMALLLITLRHDARYKAFARRLKRVRGRLQVVGGGGGRPEPQPPVPRRLRLVPWAARKACEIHVVVNVVTVIAFGQWLLDDIGLLTTTVYLGAMTPTACAVAVWTIARSQHNGSAEREFAVWYRVPPGHEMVSVAGWWNVRPAEDGETEDSAKGRENEGQQSS
jgi:hypothetical protein